MHSRTCVNGRWPGAPCVYDHHWSHRRQLRRTGPEYGLSGRPLAMFVRVAEAAPTTTTATTIMNIVSLELIIGGHSSSSWLRETGSLVHHTPRATLIAEGRVDPGLLWRHHGLADVGEPLELRGFLVAEGHRSPT